MPPPPPPFRKGPFEGHTSALLTLRIRRDPSLPWVYGEQSQAQRAPRPAPRLAPPQSLPQKRPERSTRAAAAGRRVKAATRFVSAKRDS